MSIFEWMDKEDLVCLNTEILFSHEKERNPVIYDNMEKPWGNYAKWNKSDTVRYHLYVESKTADLTEGEYHVGCQGLRGGENEGMVDKG